MTGSLAVELTRIRALLLLHLDEPRSAVEWATEKVSLGEDDPILVELAGLSNPTREMVEGLLSALADDLGLEILTHKGAGMAVAEWEARELVRGSATPIEAARTLWRLARLVPSTEPRLRVFVGLASEWEDDPDNRASYEEEIRSEALRLAGWPV